MSGPYDDHDDIAEAALEVCERVRECAPSDNYRHYAIQCRTEPERMSQIMLALAAMVDTNESLSHMAGRVTVIGIDRARNHGRQP